MRRGPFAGALLLWALCAQASDGVTIGMQLEPPILDPTANPAAAISEVLDGNVYEGLVQFAADGSVVPKLAAAWDISEDGLSYVFHLQKGVRFHDGSVFDATVAKFSLDRARAPGSANPQKSRLSKISAVDVVDPLTVCIALKQRSGGLLQSLAWGAFVMVSPRSAAENAAHPIGTGPFRFSGWRRGDSITLTRNADYWGGAPALSEATFKFIADPTAAYAALMAGDVNAFANYPAPESFAQFAADPRFGVFAGATEMKIVLALNEREPPLGNPLVRRAISHALDRRAIIDGAMFGYGTPIGSHFSARDPAYVDLTGVYPHDAAKARTLLAAAGYPRGFSVTLKLPPPSYARRGGEIVAAQLAQAGIRVRIENLEWAQWLDQVFARHDFDMSIVGHAEPMDYDIYARDDYYFGYSSPEFKALIGALDDTIDAARRRDLLQQIQRKLADDAVNGFLFQYPRLDIWDVHLRGIGFDNVLGVVDLSRARFDRGAAAGARIGGDIGGHIGAGDGAGHSAGNGAGNGAGEGTGERAAAARPSPLRFAGGVLSAAALILCFLAARRFGGAYLLGRLGVLAATLIAATLNV